MKRYAIAGSAVLVVLIVIFFFQNRSHKVAATNPPTDSLRRLWYKNSVIYNLDVKVFKDSDGDGVGDFNGLTSRLGYLDSLGITVLWLAPFMPSPLKDDGYDIVDYLTIDKRVGTLSDFHAFMQSARTHHFRVIIDLVLNHTSDQNPWFKQARIQGSPFHDWYVWSGDRPSNYNEGQVFPGIQQHIWDYDLNAKLFYYHRFYDFQPDLNIQNPEVWKKVKQVIKFWIGYGVDGFRLDGVPFVIEVPQTKGTDFPHQYWRLTALRRYIDSLKHDGIILGEANVSPDENQKYFGGNGEAMNMMFNFYVNQNLFYAFATGDPSSLKKALKATGSIPGNAAWGQFLRNHDEIDLGRLSKSQREQVYKKFGPLKDMQLYDRGIRRRLASMLNDDGQFIRFAYSMLFSLPSTPVIRYGDELGMGDDQRLAERLSVRTPMQWNSGKNSGFSSSSKLIRPVIADGVFSYRIKNAAAEEKDPGSLYRWTRKIIQLRKEYSEIGSGDWKVFDTGSSHVLGLLYKWRGAALLTLHNFSDQPQRVKFNMDDLKTLQMMDVINSLPVDLRDGAFEKKLEAHEFIWLRHGS